MINRSRFARGMAAGAGLLSAPAWLAGIRRPSAAADRPPLRIGLIFPFTGPDPIAGQEFDSAVTAFVRDHGDTIAGRKVDFVKRDTTGPNPEVVKRVVQEAIISDKVDLIVGLSYTPDVLAAASISTQAKMPLFIVNASTAGIFTNAPYMARFGFTSGQVAVPPAQWAFKSGIRTVFNLLTDYGPGIERRYAIHQNLRGRRREDSRRSARAAPESGLQLIRRAR